MSDPRFPILIVGASTRAAAFSALRAGYQPLCLDAYADVDLSNVATVQAIAPYPEGLLDALESIPRCPLLYVGGLENHLPILKRAAELHDLLGNGPDVVAKVRDPEQIRQAIEPVRLKMPETRSASSPPPADGQWMLKPQASAGGKGVTVWNDAALASPTLQVPHYFQRRIAGKVCSALFLANQGIGDIRYIGLSEQIVGNSLQEQQDFTWCGNIAPLNLSIPVENLVRRMGNQLKSQFGLVGLFGIDFIVDDNRVPWLIEVNPRYPASTELLEFATGQLFIPHHVASFAAQNSEVLVPRSRWRTGRCGPMLGKQVVYARRDFTFNSTLLTPADVYHRFPEIADIPPVGKSIRAGEPICTVYASANSLDNCRLKLQSSATRIEQQLLNEST